MKNIATPPVSPSVTRPITLPTLLLLSALLTACATPPPTQKLAMDMPAAFKETSLWKVARADSAAMPDDWWRLFDDPVLNELQSQLVVGNENLKASAAQIQVARAALGSSQAGLSPTLGVSAGGTRSATSATCQPPPPTRSAPMPVGNLTCGGALQAR